MRSEQEMYDLILGVAQRDERIRAVYMNGSRTNSNVPKDIFQDFDIVYVVTETASFLKDDKWINVFGDLIMLQEPEKLDQGIGKEIDLERSYGYLMLFRDGNRIDLHIQRTAAMLEEYGEDKLTAPLLDKDNCLPPIPTPTDHHQKSFVQLINSGSVGDWTLSQEIANILDFSYPTNDDENMTAYLQHVRTLPRDATGIY